MTHISSYMRSPWQSTDSTIDHVGVVGLDIAALRDLYTQLGFTVTKPVPLMQPAPDGKGEVPLGQVSARIVLAESYIELTAVRHLGQGNPLDRWLQRRAGLHTLAFRTSDVAGSAKDFINAGLVMPPLRGTSYRVHGSEGDGIARFKWVELPESISREGFTTVVEHLTPELVFAPTLAHHANGARRLRAVFAIVEDMEEAFARYQRLPGTKRRSFVVGRTIQMRDQQLIVVEPKGFAALFTGVESPAAPCLGGFNLSVNNLEDTRHVLDDANVPYRPWGAGGIWVAPEFTGGAVLAFTEERAA